MVDPTGFSKLPSYLLSAWKQKKADEEAAYLAACASMTVAIDTFPDTILENTANQLSPLLTKSPRQFASDALKIIRELKIKNPSNTKFLTEVLNTTAEYIKSIGTERESDAFKKYETMRERVDAKYGRYSALSASLLGLPASIIIGGMIGTAALVAAFPLAVPAIAIASVMVVMIAAIVSTMPSNESSKISKFWDNLKLDLGPTRPSLGR